MARDLHLGVMQFKSFIICLIAFLMMIVSSVGAHAGNVQFNGIVIPDGTATSQVVEQPGTLVSFSDRVALAVPAGFKVSKNIRISNEAGDLVSSYELMNVASSNGSNSTVAVVRLGKNQFQSFLLCSESRCIRYNVARY